LLFKEKIMKRLLLVGAVALLAAAVFGCVEQATEDASEYDAQGRRLVTFNIPARDYETGTGGGVTRALTKPLAQTTWDYVEVVFTNGTEYYADFAVRGKDMYFTLPEGSYKAVMFVGVGKGTRLLAVGVPTSVDGSATGLDKQGSIPITATTKKITFTLSALTTDIVGAGSFQLDVGANTADGTYALDGTDVPYFHVPVNAAGIGGTFRIGGFNDGALPPASAVGVPDDGDLFNATGLFGVLDAASSTPIIQAIGTTAYDPVTGKLVPPMTVGGQVNTIRIASGVLAIGFELATNINGLTAGFSRIRFDVPIQAFTAGNAEIGRGHVWHIVNGLEAVYDLGGDSMGENILLYGIIGETYYVSAAPLGSDANHGMTEDKPFETLAKAVEVAMGNSLCKEIIVLSNLAAADLVMIDGSGAVNTKVITIRGKTGAEKLTRSSGTDNNVIKIQGGAKVSFKDITIDGGATTNRGLYVTGAGTEVTLGADAEISGKLTNGYGGGVYMEDGKFTMEGTAIIRGSAYYGDGGGVFVWTGEFKMTGGEISDSKVSVGVGGGVCIVSGKFTMTGGEISGNTAIDAGGGGVYVGSSGEFTMSGGMISGNTAIDAGGVYVSGTFTMWGGVIYGSGAGTGLANTATNGAVFYSTSGTAKWNKDKDGNLVPLNTTNDTLNLQ
jgi:hypothetical protein